MSITRSAPSRPAQAESGVRAGQYDGSAIGRRAKRGAGAHNRLASSPRRHPLCAISIKRPIFSPCESGCREDPMRPIERTVWYVESHLNTAMSLDDIAKIAGLSKFALTRAFLATTGHTVLAYARARRLSEAAKSLQRGAPSILDLALSVGYGSYEPFSRAFRGHFGFTPRRDSLRPTATRSFITEVTSPTSTPSSGRSSRTGCRHPVTRPPPPHRF